MTGRSVAMAAVAGVVAFGAAFGIAKASSGGDKAAPKTSAATVRLPAADLPSAKVQGFTAGGKLAAFKPARRTAKPSASASPRPSTTTTPPATTTVPPAVTTVPPVVTTVPPVVTTVPPDNSNNGDGGLSSGGDG